MKIILTAMMAIASSASLCAVERNSNEPQDNVRKSFYAQNRLIQLSDNSKNTMDEISQSTKEFDVYLEKMSAGFKTMEQILSSGSAKNTIINQPLDNNDSMKMIYKNVSSFPEILEKFETSIKNCFDENRNQKSIADSMECFNLIHTAHYKFIKTLDNIKINIQENDMKKFFGALVVGQLKKDLEDMNAQNLFQTMFDSVKRSSDRYDALIHQQSTLRDRNDSSERALKDATPGMIAFELQLLNNKKMAIIKVMRKN
jgi:hypothetical protein